MELGMIGLDRMGGNMAQRLIDDGHQVVAYDPVKETVEPIFKTLAPSSQQGYGYVGPSGANHFVKMVHNGVEYGLMQSYAEGFELMQAKQEFYLDLRHIWS